MLFTLTACGGGDGKPLDQSAAIMCEKFVKERLKSPGSADFSGVTETKITPTTEKAPWTYLVNGYVDSQNSFGASVRNDYRCLIKTSDDKTWTLVQDLKLTQH
ncbi:hypothetical protein E6R60_26225 [Streptomyces sp. A0642]|nr:hypothetical protein E6R60_26225 [Streptomyces sp. A0642]